MQLAISAIVIAIQMINKHCKKLKYKRKIVLITDGRGSMDANDISQITEKIKSDEMELVIMYATDRWFKRMTINRSQWSGLRRPRLWLQGRGQRS